MPPLQPKIFFDLSLLWEGGIIPPFDLAKVLLQCATPRPIFISIVIIVGRGNMLLLRLTRGISSGCHHATPKPNFLNCHYCWKGIMLLIRLSQVISTGCHHASVHPIFFGIVIIVGRDIVLLRLSQGISSRFHHATPTPFSRNCHYCGKGHYVSASTYSRYFFRLPPCHPYTKFFRLFIIVGRVHYNSAST